VDKLSAMGQPPGPTQPSIPPGLVNERETFNNGRLGPRATFRCMAAQVKVREKYGWKSLCSNVVS